MPNAHLFPDGQPGTDVLLAARGFDENPDSDTYGQRSGGLCPGARVVTIPVDAILCRLYLRDGDFGEWWFTPHEFRRLFDHFGLDMVTGSDRMTAGRAKGRSGLHGALALLSDWYKGSAAQLSRFHLVRTREPVQAMYGPGDVAVSGDQTTALKPFRLGDGQPPRQLFLPRAWTYRDSFEELRQSGGDTDSGLARALAGLPRVRLPFE